MRFGNQVRRGGAGEEKGFMFLGLKPSFGARKNLTPDCPHPQIAEGRITATPLLKQNTIYHIFCWRFCQGFIVKNLSLLPLHDPLGTTFPAWMSGDQKGAFR
jgi:hypothetical protein